MTTYQVKCIRKRGSHYDPHERIEGIGGGETILGRWYHPEDTAITYIEAGINNYYVSVNGRTVDVVVAVHSGRKYLKTRADNYRPDNLLALPECPAL
jgi:hypothetical protein